MIFKKLETYVVTFFAEVEVKARSEKEAVRLFTEYIKDHGGDKITIRKKQTFLGE